VDDLSVIEPTAPGEPRAVVTGPEPATPAGSEPVAATTQPIPVVTTERCAQCAAPLAHDQRYCLQCGEPRPHLGGPPSAVKPAVERPSQTPLVPPGYSPVAPTAASTRNNSLALLAGVGVLLLAMGVGVLIGRAGVGTAKVPPAQVISVGGGTGAALGASTTPTATTPAAETPTTETPATSSKKKKEAKAKEPVGAGSSITKPAPSSVLKNLNKGHENGQSYEEKSKALPNVVLTK
jgi:hypothetical protein